jgi:hypothetical protein
MVTVCALRMVITPSLDVGVAVAAIQLEPLYVSHVAVAFQLPVAFER